MKNLNLLNIKQFLINKKNEIIFYILSLGEEWYIKSFDLAIDVKISILDLISEGVRSTVFAV